MVLHCTSSVLVFRITDVVVVVVLHLKMFKVCLLRISLQWKGRMQLFPLFLSHTTIRCLTQCHMYIYCTLCVCSHQTKNVNIYASVWVFDLTSLYPFHSLFCSHSLLFSPLYLTNTFCICWTICLFYSLHLPYFLVFVHLCHV